MSRRGLPEGWAPGVSHITRAGGMMKVGDGHGFHLNSKPDPARLFLMWLAFGWTWVPDSTQLIDAAGTSERRAD